MHVRAVNAQVQPGKTQEAIDLFKDAVLPAQKAQKGYQGTYLMTDACRRSTILSVGNGSGKMSGHGRTDIECQRAEPITGIERSIGTTLVDAGGGPASWSK